MAATDDAADSAVRIFENLPVIGHAIAAVHGARKDRSRAERAAIKASVGLLSCPFSFPAELIDEITRKRQPLLSDDPSKQCKSYPDWMKDLQEVKFCDLIFPASHQSGMSSVIKMRNLPTTIGWSKCQDLDLTQQLLKGVRFFDLRLMSKSDGSVVLHHNVVTGPTLQTILLQVKHFLIEQPTEFVCIFMTNDGKDLNSDVVRDISEEIFQDMLTPQLPMSTTLGELVSNGYRVVIFGLPPLNIGWQNLKFRWPHAFSPSNLKKDFLETITARNNCNLNSGEMFWYKAECTADAAVVLRDYGGLLGVLFRKCLPDKFAFVKGLAAAANAAIYGELVEMNELPFNVLSTDFVCCKIIEQIIRLNTNKAKLAPMANISMASSICSINDIARPNISFESTL